MENIYKYPRRVSDKYYIVARFVGHDSARFYEVRGIPIKVKELPGLDLFATRGYNQWAGRPYLLRGHGWTITEGITGGSLINRADATDAGHITRLFREYIKKMGGVKPGSVPGVIDAMLKLTGPSPRYQVPQ